MKFIEFTNAAEEYEGRTLCINVDHIVSIVRDEEDDTQTILFSVAQSVWKIEEDYDTVLKMIQN